MTESDFLDELLDPTLANKHVEQNSEQWDRLRIGRFTASEIHKLMTEPRSKAAKENGELSETAKNYIMVKVAETLSGRKNPDSYAYPIVYGKETEPEAIEYFIERTGFNYEKIGFIAFSDHAGGSPDGLVNGNEILEIKCPWSIATQVDYLMLTDQYDLKRMFPEYYWQCQANLLFTDTKLCHFVTYDPRYEESKFKMTHLKVAPHADDQQAICDKVAKATEEKLKLIKLLS
jgi:hypothetical protein